LGLIPNPLNGYQLTRKDVKELVKRFATLDYHQRLAILGMSDKCAEIILAGSIVLLEAMTMLDIDKLVLL
jgi:exopolyphosphatase/guanosine-5'-triphosphate,3'-diphosphate pyrophosphatase